MLFLDSHFMYMSRSSPLLQHVVDIPQPVVRTRRQDFADCIVQYFHFGLFLRSECRDDRAAQIRPPFELELIPVERTHKTCEYMCGILGRGLTSNRGSTEAEARCTARTKTVHNVPHRNSRRRCDFASTRCHAGTRVDLTLINSFHATADRSVAESEPIDPPVHRFCIRMKVYPRWLYRG